jgi:SH3 domain protein
MAGSALRAGAFAAALLVVATSAARAERAWVRGDVRLNVRTGPGTEFRIIEMLTTGDEVRVIERGTDWIRVALAEKGEEGWIPEGYLQTEPPAALQLEEVRAELARVRAELEAATTETGRLKETGETLASRDGEQRAAIDRLTQENVELRAGARVPELVAGASILGMGMIVGALLYRGASRSRPSRIRL